MTKRRRLPQSKHLTSVRCVYVYSRFRVFSPDCTLHSAITHVIKVWDRRRLMWISIVQLCVGVRHSNTKITRVIAECNVQSGLKTLKQLYRSMNLYDIMNCIHMNPAHVVWCLCRDTHYISQCTIVERSHRTTVNPILCTAYAQGLYVCTLMCYFWSGGFSADWSM